ncbi:MAG TPA: hypothetical protein VNC39_07570 [Acidocella sp.]|uniref:hypothetical protein n=1 Tax=Acidocella sp. TaxID=50710 RepID=UPI002D13476B|nr:hypothetical protein [Acidocella sp.]HVE21817.1 hypothetical protein [Acidocella sp.]
MSARFAAILAHNARIAMVLRRAKAELEAIGEPKCFTAAARDLAATRADFLRDRRLTE